MESIWDYVMRRKPLFLGYFALFFISGFMSCKLLNHLLPTKPLEDPGIVQEQTPPSPTYNNSILSPEAVASLLATNDAPDSVSLRHPDTIASQFVHVEITNPTEPSSADQTTPLEDATDSTVAVADESAVAVPLTSTPRKVSIFRTVLAVLLAVTSLTCAGFGLYQTYEYFRAQDS